MYKERNWLQRRDFNSDRCRNLGARVGEQADEAEEDCRSPLCTASVFPMEEEAGPVSGDEDETLDT